jgi:hypothetical protein
MTTDSTRFARFSLVLLVLAVPALAACPAEEGGIDLESAILVNDASEEVLGVIADAVDNGLVQIDDGKAAAIVTPEPGAVVPRATPLQFAWALPSAKPSRAPRHGKQTGDYLWMRLSGGGLTRDIDMVAVDVTSWTPTAEQWAEISAATGPITITLTYAFVMDGVIADGGPYRSTAPTTFSIGD